MEPTNWFVAQKFKLHHSFHEPQFKFSFNCTFHTQMLNDNVVKKNFSVLKVKYPKLHVDYNSGLTPSNE